MLIFITKIILGAVAVGHGYLHICNCMKHLILYPFCLLSFFITQINAAKASHILGAELFYTYLSTNSNGDETYRITLKLFGDCGSNALNGGNGAYEDLIVSRPSIYIYNGNTLVNQIMLNMEPYPASNIEITPVCPAQKDSTNCNIPGSALLGVTRYIYSGLITLNGTSNDWRFLFNGVLNSNSSAGRSTSIMNIFNIGNSMITLRATLNNTTGPNSSTQFTSEPTPFFCINLTQEYNLGAVDPNGDSLGFSLVSALESTQANCTYISGYSPTQPIATAVGGFNYNPVNGQLSFTPNLVMNGVVVNQVNEYKNGVLMGSSMREMTFVIMPNCLNSPPDPGFVTDLSGGYNSALNEISTCQGQTEVLSFNFSCSDVNGDSITITYTGIPTGAVVNIVDNNTTNPSFFFQWDVTNVAAGTYNFFVTLTDNGCPISSRQTIAYTIQVAPLMNSFDTGTISGCAYDSSSMVWVTVKNPNDTMEYTITWWDSTTTELQSNTTKTGDTLFNVPIGTYTVHIRNADGCVATSAITIAPPTYKASFVTDSIVCVLHEVDFENTSTNDINAWEWDFGDSTLSTQRDPTHTYTIPGTYIVRLTGTTDFPCQDTAYMTIVVDSTPRVVFDISKDRICEGETVIFSPSFTVNADSLVWDIEGVRVPVVPATDTPRSYLYDHAGIFFVSLTGHFPACPDSTYIDTVFVSRHPIVNLRPDTSICPNAQPIDLQNLVYEELAASYLWNTGETTPGILVYEPGVYHLTITSSSDCQTTDSVTVARSCYIDIPNVFTPDGDGLNDYFFPRELLSMKVTRFHMRIFNRWGTLLFETTRTDGRGWDGRFNGEIQPGGVYVYMIKAEIDSHIEETHNGNVTLLR